MSDGPCVCGAPDCWSCGPAQGWHVHTRHGWGEDGWPECGMSAYADEEPVCGSCQEPSDTDVCPQCQRRMEADEEEETHVDG